MESLAPYRAYLDAVPSALRRTLPRPARGRLDFLSNDYCAASAHPAVRDAAIRATRRYGTGSGGSRLLGGVRAVQAVFERRVARDLGADAALLFASGWQANVAVVSSLLLAAPPESARVYCDRLIHASLHDAIRLGGARQIRFAHNDLDALETRLAAAPSGTRAFIVTESLYGMDGDRADLPRLTAIARAHDAICIVDEAHAIGVAGPRGYGFCEAHARDDRGRLDPRFVVLGTLSKALGCVGGFVACSGEIADYLVQACRGFMFATAPAPPQIAAAWAAWRLVARGAAARAALATRAETLRAALRARGFATGDSTTHIVPLVTGDAETAARLRDGLARAGIDAALIRPPTVPPRSSRVRLALRTDHTDADLARLLAAVDAAA